VGDSPYPGSPLSELQVLLRIAEDTASIRGHIRAIDLRQAERGKPDSLPPMRPRLDTHRGLGVPEETVSEATLVEQAVETVQDRKDLAIMRKQRERLGKIVVGVAIGVGTTVAWECLKIGVAVFTGHH
jgi:hypothetical protein